MGIGWNKSVVGSKMSCIAVCEMIDDESVKCKVHGENHSIFINNSVISVTMLSSKITITIKIHNLLVTYMIICQIMFIACLHLLAYLFKWYVVYSFHQLINLLESEVH